MRLSARFNLAFLLFSTTLLAQSPVLKRDGSNWTQTEEGSFSLGAGGELRVRAQGNIRVRGAAGAHLSYKLSRSVRNGREPDARSQLERYPTEARVHGNSAVIQVAAGPFATELEISVPRGLARAVIETVGGNLDISDLDGSLVAQASGGRINIGRMAGDIDIQTAGGAVVLGTIGGTARCVSGGGAIHATEIRGDALLETAGGDIVLRKAGGRVQVVTGGGSISVIDAAGTVVAKTSGGPIRIGSARGFHCESASGSIEAELAPGAAGIGSYLSTGAGDITVWIPSNLQISIRAQNGGSGDTRMIGSDFPGFRVQGFGAEVAGELNLNGGGPLLQLTGNGGRIYIRKR